VVCGTAELEDDTLLNPMLLIEVISASTERYDRGHKAEDYRRLATLRELLLVTQNEPEEHVTGVRASATGCSPSSAAGRNV
jgi:Uma2 family endonuclease